MAAHSACDFGGGKAERLALAKYRSVVWQGRVSNAQLSSLKLRELGKCPLTPEEVGIMLAALGFGPHTQVYLASYTVSVTLWWNTVDRDMTYELQYSSFHSQKAIHLIFLCGAGKGCIFLD